MSSLHILPVSQRQFEVGLQASGVRWLELSCDFAALMRQAEHTAQQARVAETTVSSASVTPGIQLSEKRRQVSFAQRRSCRKPTDEKHQLDVSG